MPTTVTFEQTTRDVREMHSYLIRRGTYRWRVYRPVVMQSLFVAWALLVAWFAAMTGEAIMFFAFVGAAGAFLLVTLVWLVAALRLPATESARWSKDPYLRLRGLGKQSVTVSPDGLVWTHQAGEGRVFWPAVSAIDSGPTAIIFYLGPGSVISVPARAFASAEEMRRFADEAEAYRQQAIAGGVS